MSVCAKFQLFSWSRSAWKVCGGVGGVGWCGFQVTTVSNLNEVAFELLWVELSYVGVWQYLLLTIFKSLVQLHLDYSCQLWCPADPVSINKIEGVKRSSLARIRETRLKKVIGISWGSWDCIVRRGVGRGAWWFISGKSPGIIPGLVGKLNRWIGLHLPVSE